MMKIATSARVSATIPTNASVSRAWNVRGTSRRSSFEGRPPAASALGERVTDTAHRHDEGRRRGIVLDLVPQVADVDVDRLLVLIERLVVAEQLEQLRSRVDAAGPRCKVTQDLELGRSEADPPLATLDPSALEIDHQVAV